MEITKYEHFFDLYKHLNDAVFSIWTKTTEIDSDYTIELKNNIGKILIETDGFNAISFDSIMNDIKQFLFTLTKENKESYIMGILQEWVKFVPLFDIHDKRKTYWIDGNLSDPNNDFVNAAKNSIRKNEQPLVLLKASVFEQYLFCCYRGKQQFFKLLSDFLYILDIDFNLLQDKVYTPPQISNKKNDSVFSAELSKYSTNTNPSDFWKNKAIKNLINENAIEELIKHIKYDKGEITKNKVKEYINRLIDNKVFNNANKKEFSTIALIFYQTGWLTNIKTFTEWKSLFSDTFERKTSTYKPKRLKQHTETIKAKIPFLDEFPVSIK